MTVRPASDVPPEATFLSDNLMALGALDEIRKRGFRIPDDIALASFDDVPWFAHVNPPITAITSARSSPMARTARLPSPAVGFAVRGGAATVRKLRDRLGDLAYVPHERLKRRSHSVG
ncbi:substrate-binding domain-containing protein [Planotetraspora sp. GP83]|uniref:substrate-binding domain-containing protein n=1 Tax=Planotetraspora sp. GP83 TaxID=3156264 RepID=UPI00351702C4